MKFLVLMLFSTMIHSYEGSDTFIVKFFDEKVKVLAPKKFDKRLSVIVENKTLVKLRGKIENSQGSVLSFLSVNPNESYSVDLKIKKGQKVFFVPISPSFQKVRLEIGKASYEIPPKK